MRAKASDPMGMNSELDQIAGEITESLGDTNFDYGYSHTDDNSVPWDPSAMPSQEETAVAASPKKTAPRKAAAKSTAAKSAKTPAPKAPTPKAMAAKPAVTKVAKAKPIVEGGGKAEPTIVASAKPKRAPAKKAV